VDAALAVAQAVMSFMLMIVDKDVVDVEGRLLVEGWLM
jgi:hypothetical protein